MLLTIIVNSYVLSLKLLEYRADKLNMKFLGYQNVDKSFVHLLFDRKLLDLSDKFYRLEDREAPRSGAAWSRDTTCRYGPPSPFLYSQSTRRGAGERSKSALCLLFNP